MLTWAIIFLIIALISGALGFYNVAGISAGISKFLFVLFVIVFLVLLIMSLMAAV